MLSSKPPRFNWEDDCCVPLCVPLNFFFMWKTVFPLNRSLFAFCRCCIMQVFVCSGWAGNLRKWETLAPTPFCEFVHLRAEAENDPKKPAESLQSWHPGSRIFASQPMRCVLMFGFGMGFVSSSSPQSHVVKDAEVRAQLSAPGSGTLGACVQLLGWRRRRMEPCALLQHHWQLSLQSCSAVLQPSVPFASLLWPSKITNICVLCRHQSMQTATGDLCAVQRHHCR